MQAEEDEPSQQHTDPFGELADERNVFVKIESSFVNEEHSNVEDTADIATDVAIAQEISIDDIKSEWVSTASK